MRLAKPKPTDLTAIDADLTAIRAMRDGNRLDGAPGPYAYAITMHNVGLVCSLNPTFRRVFRS